MTKTFGPLNKGRGGVALWIVLVVIVFVEI